MALTTHFPAEPSQNSIEEEPIRIFKSDILEWFTHIHPAVVPLVWLPFAVVFMALYLQEPTASLPRLFTALLIGAVLVWSFIEYVMHRFVFHFKPRTAFQERVLFMLHEVHHVQPHCKTRLVMSPPVSLSIAAFFYALFVVVVEKLLGMPEWVEPLFAGAIVGYVAYDMTHYAVHHWPLRNRLFKALKRHHLLHHFDDPGTRYGVTSPVWDYVFRTQKGSFWGKGR